METAMCRVQELGFMVRLVCGVDRFMSILKQCPCPSRLPAKELLPPLEP